MLSLHLNPFKPAKRYSSLPASDHSDTVTDSDVDLEKRSSFDSDNVSDVSTPSSRRSSASIHYTAPRRRPSAVAWSRPTTRLRHSWGRYFSLCLGASLVVLALALWQLSVSSAKQVQQGFKNVEQQAPPWEEFPFLERYYGGIRTLVSREKNKPEYPSREKELEEIANLTSTRDEGETEGDATPLDRRASRLMKEAKEFSPYSKDERVTKCFLDEKDTISVPSLLAYPGIVKGMPDPIIGAYDVLGLDNSKCFDRFGRLAPYGLGYSQKKGGSGAGMEGDHEGIQQVWSTVPQVDFRRVKWNSAQQRCVEKNAHRFKSVAEAETIADPPQHRNVSSTPDSAEAKDALSERSSEKAKSSSSNGATTGRLPRTAILIRTWHDYQYDTEDILYLRALIAELSINSGGEYTVHFLIHVKDDNLQVWADEATYNKVLNASLPAEFAGMGSLWSERQMGLIYGGLADTMYRELPVHGVYRSAFMPVQWFAYEHPEYDFFWHWEMDVRYIGHYYELVDRTSKWAKEQPRKGLWERSARFYVPSEHGSWDDFKHMVRVQTEHGTSSSWKNNAANAWSKLAGSNPNVPEYARPDKQQKPENPIWGADDSLDPTDNFEAETDPKPPHELAEDKFTWGVGEEADLILFNPLFDPEGTEWLLAQDYTGYNTSSGQIPPRRASIGTTGRYSRRLLDTMHRETALKRHTMFSEMWPATTCLHHGLKAVYVPHPVYIDRRWPTSYLAAIFNNGRNGASGGSRKSVFSEEQQHNFRGTTWYYNAEFAVNLWTRWLGYKVNNDGGEEFEMTNEGRMCLPSVLLHPVKHVEMVWEHGEWDEIADDEKGFAKGALADEAIGDAAQR